jgi:hypothetical protein
MPTLCDFPTPKKKTPAGGASRGHLRHGARGGVCAAPRMRAVARSQALVRLPVFVVALPTVSLAASTLPFSS